MKMKQTQINAPNLVILREIKIQEVLYNNEITIAVINKSKIPKHEATEWLQIAFQIINQFDQNQET